MRTGKEVGNASPDFLKVFVGFSLRSVLSSWPRDWRLPRAMIPGFWDGFSGSVAARPTRARALPDLINLPRYLMDATLGRTEAQFLPRRPLRLRRLR